MGSLEMLPGTALRWERLTHDRGLGADIRPPGFGAALGSRAFIALADAHLATLVFAAGPEGVPVAMSAAAATVTGLAAQRDRLVMTGVRTSDGRCVAIEMDASGGASHEVELPIREAPHRHPQPVSFHPGMARIVWEERGPGPASTLLWADLARGRLGPVQRHVWTERTAALAPSAGREGVWLLRSAGQPRRSQLVFLGESGIERTTLLPAPAIGNAALSGSGEETAVLLVPSPGTLELGLVDSAGRLAPDRTALLAVPAPGAIDGALLVAAGAGVWGVAAASSKPGFSTGVPGGEPERRTDFVLVACDARTRAAGPPQPIGPPLAAAWVGGRLVLWTGRAGAALSTWGLAV